MISLGVRLEMVSLGVRLEVVSLGVRLEVVSLGVRLEMVSVGVWLEMISLVRLKMVSLVSFILSFRFKYPLSQASILRRKNVINCD